jgi:hypothetical protein
MDAPSVETLSLQNVALKLTMPFRLGDTLR